MVGLQPAGLLAYLESDEAVPDDDIDRINIRDNLKLAQVCVPLVDHLFRDFILDFFFSVFYLCRCLACLVMLLCQHDCLV